MKKFPSFLVGVVFGATLMYVALKYHVVRAPDGFHLVPKTTARLNSVYVDIRQFRIQDWDDHRELALDLASSDKAYLLRDTAENSLSGAVQDVLDGFGAGNPN